MRDESGYEVKWVDSADKIPVSLWDACFPPPIEGFWWYSALEKAGLEDQFTFSYGIIYKENNPVGIAPSFLMDVPIDIVMPAFIAFIMRTLGIIFKPLRYQRTLFVGSPCSDEGTVGLLPGVSLKEVSIILQNSLIERMCRERAAVIVWKDFPGSAAGHLEGLCESHGLFKMVSFPGTILEITPNAGFEGYLKSLSSYKRNWLKRKLRKGSECGEIECEIINHPDEKALKEIFALFWQTYLKGKTKFERLNYRFFENISAFESSYYIVLRRPETKSMVAFMLCFKLGRTVINKFIGIDYTLGGNWYLYFRLNEKAIDWATRAGAELFQSGQTGYRAKLDLGHKLVPLTNYCMQKNRFINFIFATIAKKVTLGDLDKDLKEYIKSR